MTKNGWWVSVPGARSEYIQACILSDLFPVWQVANEITKPHVAINPTSSSTDCQKTATWNGNLQPEIESNEYSSTRSSPNHVWRHSVEAEVFIAPCMYVNIDARSAAWPAWMWCEHAVDIRIIQNVPSTAWDIQETLKSTTGKFQNFLMPHSLIHYL